VIGWAALGLGAAGLATLLRARAHDGRATRDFPPEGQILEIDGVPVHALQMGQGPDLVFIHGASGNIRDVTHSLMPRLATRYRVTALDRPGLGHTGRLPGHGGLFDPAAESPAEQARLLQDAAARLGVQRPVVIGQSYGGAVALAWALGRPDTIAGLVSLAGVAMPWPGKLGLRTRIIGTRAGGALLPPVLAAWLPDRVVARAIEDIFAPQAPPPGYMDHIGAPLILRAAAFRANGRQVNSLRPHVVAMAPHYPALRLPIEIVHGDADTTVPLEIHSEPLSRLVPGARLTVLPGIGHMPHHAAPEAVEAAIDRAVTRAGLH